jgi:hypothetical protein
MQKCPINLRSKINPSEFDAKEFKKVADSIVAKEHLHPHQSTQH